MSKIVQTVLVVLGSFAIGVACGMCIEVFTGYLEAKNTTKPTVMEYNQLPITPKNSIGVTDNTKENALMMATKFNSLRPNSKQATYIELMEKGFSEENASYAVENIDLDWAENAYDTAVISVGLGCFSPDGTPKPLTEKELRHILNDLHGYTEEETRYALARLTY